MDPFLIDDVENSAPIDELYAYISIDELGHEGILAQVIPGVGVAPFVTGSKSVLDKMRPFARAAAAAGRSSKRIRLVRFMGREVIEEL
jgi:hypothetical protein